MLCEAGADIDLGDKQGDFAVLSVKCPKNLQFWRPSLPRVGFDTVADARSSFATATASSASPTSSHKCSHCMSLDTHTGSISSVNAPSATCARQADTSHAQLATR